MVDVSVWYMFVYVPVEWMYMCMLCMWYMHTYERRCTLNQRMSDVLW